MPTNNETTKLAQSASAIGAAILGFGIGAQWGTPLKNFAIEVVVIGAIIHTYGMYIIQIKNKSKRTSQVAKILWITAWVCLIALMALFIYLIVQQK